MLKIYPGSLNPCRVIERRSLGFFSAITGSIQRLERLFRVSYINGVELEACLLSRSTLKSLISLLPTAEYDLWVREMTVSGLVFRNPVGAETFYFFKKVFVIEINTTSTDNWRRRRSYS